MLEAGKGCSSTGNTFYLILLWNYWTILKIEVYFKNKHGVADLTLRRQWSWGASLGQSNLLEQVSRGHLTLALTSNPCTWHRHTWVPSRTLCTQHSAYFFNLLTWKVDAHQLQALQSSQFKFHSSVLSGTAAAALTQMWLLVRKDYHQEVSQSRWGTRC